MSYAWSRRKDLWQYAPPLGLEELRGEISRRLADSGIERSPAEILVVSGAQQGLDLLFRTFTDPEDLVAVESPTYSGALWLWPGWRGFLAAAADGENGPDPRPLYGRRVKLAYLMPERQNPTGITTAEAQRQAVLDAALASGAIVVEDGFEEPESGLPTLCARGGDRAVWLGTLSKDLVPGIRIGWIAASRPIIERLARVKKSADFQTPVPLQAAVAAFLRAGSDRKARRGRAEEIALRAQTAAEALRQHLPDASWWGGQGSNPLFWLHLPEGVSGRRVAEAAAAKGVGVAPGQDFDPKGEDRAAVRLSVSRVERRDIERGISAAGGGGSGSARQVCRRDFGAGGVSGEDSVQEAGGRPMNTDESFRLKVGLAEMLKGGVIMDVVNAEQAKIAEAAGAAAVMALERVPADIRRDGGVARMSPVSKIREIQQAVSIPVMAKCRIGHLAEARVLEALKVDFIDESEVLTPADEENHVYKHDFRDPVRLRLPQSR